MSISTKDPESRRLLEEADLHEQEKAFKNSVTTMDIWNPFLPYGLRSQSPSPPSLYDHREINRDLDAISYDDPEWLQKMQAIVRRVPIPVRSAADRERAAEERKLLDRQIEDDKIAEKEARARWLDSLHETPLVFGQPRNPEDPVPNYCADVAKEKTALQQKRLEEDRKEQEQSKREYAIQWLDDHDSRATFFGLPCEKMTVTPGGIVDPRIQETKKQDQGDCDRMNETAIETVSWDNALDKEDDGSSSRGHIRTEDLASDSIVKSGILAQVDTETTGEDQVHATVSRPLSPTPSSNSSAGRTKSSVPESEPEVIPDGHTKNHAGAGSPSTGRSTASSQLEDRDQEAEKEVEMEFAAEKKDDH